MGLLSLLPGWDQYQAAANAVMAEAQLSMLSTQQKQEISSLILSRQYLSRTAEDVTRNLRDLSSKPRIVQMILVALACRHMGVPPFADDGGGWRFIKNPDVTGSYVEQGDINSAILAVKRKTGLTINWPSTPLPHHRSRVAEHVNDKKLDFLSWAFPLGDGPTADKKPQRGEDVRATVTLSTEVAKSGGSARVLLPTGRAFEVKVPAGVKDGAQLRLRGLGAPGLDGGEPGNALVSIEIGGV